MQSATNAMKIMPNCQSEWWVRLGKIHGENWRMFCYGGLVELQPHVLSRQIWRKKWKNPWEPGFCLKRFSYGTCWDIMGQHRCCVVMPVLLVAHLSRNNSGSWGVHWEVGRLTRTSFPAGFSATTAHFSSPGPPQWSSGSSWTSCNRAHWPAVSCQCI